MAEVDRIIVELNENLHTVIENGFQSLLAAMISGDLSFLKDDRQASTFYHALSVQYMRTNHIEKSRRLMLPESFALYERLANPLAHLIATNIGLSLYTDCSRNTITLLQNDTSTPFITADQPIINISADSLNLLAPEKFELYYPLSPRRAMLLLEPSSSFFPDSFNICESQVRAYNLRMVEHSHRQVFSSSPDVLESLKRPNI